MSCNLYRAKLSKILVIFTPTCLSIFPKVVQAAWLEIRSQATETFWQLLSGLLVHARTTSRELLPSHLSCFYPITCQRNFPSITSRKPSSQPSLGANWSLVRISRTIPLAEPILRHGNIIEPSRSLLKVWVCGRRSKGVQQKCQQLLPPGSL